MKPEEFNKKLKECPFVITSYQHKIVADEIDKIFDEYACVSLVENGSMEYSKLLINQINGISEEKLKFIFIKKIEEYIKSLDFYIKYDFNIYEYQNTAFKIKFSATLEEKYK